MASLVLERTRELALREIEVPAAMGPHDVRIKMHTVGICGSDVHYYTHGAIGPYVVRAPMVLGHEGSGTVVEVGEAVTGLRVGDRVCMEPGIPDPNGKATRLGLYNLDPAVRFWATPPVHGCLTPYVVHPAAFTFKLPDNVSFAEGAMVEPLAVGMQAAIKARIKAGDLAVVLGAGTIGMVTALAALAGGCSRVIISDVHQAKLDLARRLGPIIPVNVAQERVEDVVARLTDGWGADIVFEASGNDKAAAGAIGPLCPGGCIVFVGIPGQPISFDVAAVQAKEARIESVFRYAHVYPRAIDLIGSGRIDVKPLLTDRYAFAQSIEAFDYATHMRPETVKIQIEVGDS
jgi:D-xylulose reductase